MARGGQGGRRRGRECVSESCGGGVGGELVGESGWESATERAGWGGERGSYIGWQPSCVLERGRS